MIAKYLTAKQAESLFDQFEENSYNWCFELDNDYLNLRNELITIWDEVSSKFSNIKKYDFDLVLASKLYVVFNKFNEVDLASYDFWRYISVCVIPDLLYRRWGNVRTHFYSKTVRIYPYTLYWYIHLSWQNNLEDTFKMLNNKNCNTDTILQIVERPGRMGVNLEFYRKLMYLYCADTNENNINIFRSALTLNTARSINILPDFYLDGNLGYARDIMKDAVGRTLNGKQN